MPSRVRRLSLLLLTTTVLPSSTLDRCTHVIISARAPCRRKWVYEDKTKFVFDLFRRRTYPSVSVKCESQRGVVELQAPCVNVAPALPRQMPNIMRQLTQVMVELARAHLHDNIIELADFLAQNSQAWQEQNEVVMAQLVAGVDRMGLPADVEDNYN
jgi:hypothetical protein